MRVLERAEQLNFPTSVIEYFQGYLGIPEPWGFPEPFRSRVLKGRKLPNGKDRLEGRPGASLPPYDLEGTKKMLAEKYGESRAQDHDVLSYALYPRVFQDWKDFEDKNGDISTLPTRYFLQPMKSDEEITVDVSPSKRMYIRYKGMGEVNKQGQREVNFQIDGRPHTVVVNDIKASASVKRREQAQEGNKAQVGSPMTGAVVEVKVEAGKKVKAGEPICILSAAKMETVVAAPFSGILKRVIVEKGEKLKAGDLLVEIEAEKK